MKKEILVSEIEKVNFGRDLEIVENNTDIEFGVRYVEIETEEGVQECFEVYGLGFDRDYISILERDEDKEAEEITAEHLIAQIQKQGFNLENFTIKH